jgi:hypothetical protein
MLRRLAALSVLATCATLLAGCVSIQSITSDQQDIVGKLRLTLTICASGANDVPDPPEDHPGCLDTGNSDDTAYAFPGPTGEVELLIGFRVPVGTGAPATITATPAPAPPASGTITARRSASYEAALQAAMPAPAGSVWVGYLSDPYFFDDGADGVAAQSAQVAIDFALPPTADGGPFVGPFAVRPVVGSRQVNASYLAGRPVDCGPDAFATDFGTQTICVDSPTAIQAATSFNFPTRDFGVLAGNATASPGQTVLLPFNVRGAGALPAGLTASLSAATNLPGAGAVAPSAASAALANGSDTRVTVPVTIPKQAGPGVFDVTLTARLDNGQTRTRAAKLTVRDRQKPVLSKAKAKPRTFRAATKKKPKRGTDVSYTLSEAASVRATVQRCVKRAGKRKQGRCLRFKTLRGALSDTGQLGANELRFKGRLRGKALKPGLYRLVLTPTDAAGNVGKPVRVRFAVRK